MNITLGYFTLSDRNPVFLFLLLFLPVGHAFAESSSRIGIAFANVAVGINVTRDLNEKKTVGVFLGGGSFGTTVSGRLNFYKAAQRRSSYYWLGASIDSEATIVSGGVGYDHNFDGNWIFHAEIGLGVPVATYNTDELDGSAALVKTYARVLSVLPLGIGVRRTF